MRKKRYVHTIQMTEVDCAIACMVSLLKYYGHNVGYRYIKKELNCNNDLTTIKQISSFCKKFKIGINYYEVKTMISLKKIEFSDRQLPCMCLIKKGDSFHYVLIYKIKGGMVIYSDPAKGMLVKDKVDLFFNYAKVLITFNNVIDAVFLENVEKSKVKLDNKEIKSIFYIIVIGFIASVMTIASSFQVGIIVDVILPNKVLNPIYLLFVSLICFSMCSIIGLLIDFVRKETSIKLSKNLEKKLEASVIKSLFNMSNNVFHQLGSGELFSRVNDCKNIVGTMINVLVMTIIDMFFSIFSVIVLFFLNWRISVIFVIFITAIVVMDVLNFQKIYNLNYDAAIEYSLFSESFVNIFENIENVQVLNKEIFFKKKIIGKLNQFIKIIIKVNLKVLSISMMQQALTIGINNVILFLGMYFVLNQKMTLGNLFTYISLSSICINAVAKLIQRQFDFVNFLVSLKRVDILLNNEEFDIKPVGIEHSIMNRIKNITICNFGLKFNDNLVFDKANLNINNENIIIKGNSGCGKTSLVKCIIGLLDEYEGEILLNGVNVNALDKTEIRNRIIYVSNSENMFNGTIYENLCLGIDIPKKYIFQVCKDLEILDFINGLPKGFNHEIGKHSYNLSLGQMQRLSIVRAILKRPDILILDEALTNVDGEMKERILVNLDKYKFNIIYISHEEIRGIKGRMVKIQDYKILPIEGELKKR